MHMILVLFIILVALEAVHSRRTHIGVLNELLLRSDVAVSLDPPPFQYFPAAVVNHFPSSTPAPPATFWKQRYVVNNTAFRTGGPIFLMIGGEGPLSERYVNGAFVVCDYAVSLGGMVVALEHRYYGESQPEPADPLSLRYLSSKQAIADIGIFVDWFTRENNLTSSPWVAVGGSYSGALAAWTMQAYQGVFAGALGSSAPVLAQESFGGYFDVVTADLQTFGGDACVSTVAAAMNAAVSMYQTASGRAQLSRTFTTCKPAAAGPLELASFLEMLLDPLTNVAQYNNDNRGNGPNLAGVCVYLASFPGKTPLESLSNLNGWLTNSTSCNAASYSEGVAALSSAGADRSWTYQTCTEFGFFQIGKAAGPIPAALSLQLFVQQCVDVFNVSQSSIAASINATNTHYGAVESTSWLHNTFFANGKIDPWHVLSALPPLAPRSAARGVYGRLMNNTAHCADMYAPRAQDDPELVITRKMQLSAIRSWITHQ